MGILNDLMKEYFATQTLDQVNEDWEAVSYAREISSPDSSEFFETIENFALSYPPIEENLMTNNSLNPKFISDFFLTKTYGKSIILNS